MTVDEFEKNVVKKHHDSTTQWVNEFSKKRGWFVQVSLLKFLRFGKGLI